MLHFGKKSMISVVRYEMKCHYAEVPLCVFVAVTEKSSVFIVKDIIILFYIWK